MATVSMSLFVDAGDRITPSDRDHIASLAFTSSREAFAPLYFLHIGAGESWAAKAEILDRMIAAAIDLRAMCVKHALTEAVPEPRDPLAVQADGSDNVLMFDNHPEA